MIGAVASGNASGSSLAELKKNYGRHMLFTEFSGTSFNGKISDVIDGTAFFITKDGYAITVAHVLPDERGYKESKLVVRLGSTKGPITAASVIDRDFDNDIALLKADVPPEYDAIPVGQLSDLDSNPHLGILSFQVGSSVVLMDDGVIRTTDDDKGRWLVSVAVNPGSSGAPIFDMASGKAVCIAWGSLRFIVQMIQGTPTQVPLEKTNYGIPLSIAETGILARNKIEYRPRPITVPPIVDMASALAPVTIPISGSGFGDSIFGMLEPVKRPGILGALAGSGGVPMGAEMETRLSANHFGRSLAANITTSPTEVAGPIDPKISSQQPRTGGKTPEIPSTPTPLDIDRAYDVNQIVPAPSLKESPGKFDGTRIFNAEPGYRFSEATFLVRSSSSPVSPSLHVMPGGKQLQVTYDLRSPDEQDQQAIWLLGSVVTHQVLDH